MKVFGVRIKDLQIVLKTVNKCFHKKKGGRSWDKLELKNRILDRLWLHSKEKYLFLIMPSCI